MHFEIPVLYFFLLIIPLSYIFIVIGITIGWFRLRTCYDEDPGRFSSTAVSVLVPARNEASVISQCIHGLIAQDFPKQRLEVIIIDDHSEDQTFRMANEIAAKSPEVKVSVLSLVQSEGKKAAIQHAMLFAKGSLILCTDADCRHPKTWVASMVRLFESKQPVFISGPVVLDARMNIFGYFQEVEFMSLVASGAGAIGMHLPIMCNGANLGFSAFAYRKLDSDTMKAKITSGDDVFLMLSMKAAFGADRISFLKSREALVHSDAPSTLKGFFRQRRRWVSKSKAYRDPVLIFTAVSVFLTNALILVSAIAGIFNRELLWFALATFLLKVMVDLPLLVSFACFAGKKQRIWFILPAQPLVILFTAYAAIAGNFMKNTWKGRKVTH